MIALLTSTALPNHIRRLRPGVRWQSGDASDCKSADAGSIPARTSIISMRWLGQKGFYISAADFSIWEAVNITPSKPN